MDVIKKELFRKAFHLTGLAVPILYYFFLPRTAVLAGLALAAIAAGSLEALRLSGRDIYPDLLLRDSREKERIYGYFWGLLAMLLAVFLFDKAVAVAAMLFMLLGDSASGLAGAVVFRYRAKPLPNPKPPQAMAAMFFVCLASGLLLYPGLPLPVMVSGAIGATIVEAFSWKIRGHTVNDNLSIPLASGAIMALAPILLSCGR